MKKNIGVVVAFVALLLLAPIGALFVNGQDKQVTENNPYKEIYLKLAEIYGEDYDYYDYDDYYYTEGGFFENLFASSDSDDAVAESTTADSGAGEDADMGAVEESETDFSKTNTQEEAVDEADIIKTDGEYIYYLRDNVVHIIKADGRDLEEHSTIENELYIKDMYLKDDKLVLICEQNQAYDLSDKDDETILRAAEIFIYDISDRKQPELENKFSQSGNMSETRLVGSNLYIISNKFDHVLTDPQEYENYIPLLSKNGEKELIAPEDIYVNTKNADANDILVVSAVDIDKGVIISSKAILGYSNTVYCTTQNLYLTGYTDLSTEGVSNYGTHIMRFSLNDGNIKLAAEGEIPGSPDGQFSFNEYAGHLRVTTTSEKQTLIIEDDEYEDIETIVAEEDSIAVSSWNDSDTVSNLFVLDMNLEIVGSVEDLAKGERLYSTRYIGNMAYFVTFRNVDPLFAVDISDPHNPKLMSELKIPGFSDYMHPYGEGKLLGVGMNADPENGATDYVKLSMFDISDPEELSEEHILITSAYHSPLLYDHKAGLIDVEKNIIAFSADDNYLIYSYDEKEGFALESSIKFASSYYSRGIYIGDIIYIVAYDGIATVDINDFEFDVNFFF